MATQLSAYEVSKSFGGRLLFEKLSFGVDIGDHIGLIGANGAGKSTLLKILAGQSEADSGRVSRRQGLRIAYLPQSPELNPSQSIFSEILSGALDPDDWESSARALEYFSLFNFEAAGMREDSSVESLSGGWKKKVALARELMREPDLLLLDEPTNHLDVESIIWLEEFLARAPFSTLTITHDRLFLNRISKKIWELDRRNHGGLLVVEGDYAAYCEVKDQQIATLARQEDSLRNNYRRESEWLRKGPKARTTKQQARIDRAGAMEAELEELGLKNQKKAVNLDFSSQDGSPKTLLLAEKITKSYDGKRVFENFDLRLERGQRIGLLGANGAGKSTLIKTLLGIIEPDQGKVIHNERLSYAYFDQGREALDPKKTVLKTVCPQGEHVKFRGAFVHVRSYLDRFLFSAAQAESPVSQLSGGEQARLVIARLMLTDANLLVLDEPTNDLDLATLNILEERLRDFEGAVILVTHDRYFLDQVVDQIYAPAHGNFLAFHGLAQWEAWQKEQVASKNNKKSKASTPNLVTKSPSETSKRLSFNEQRELDQMEATLSEKEQILKNLEAELLKPEVSQNPKLLTETSRLLAESQSEIESLYARWSELEAKTK